MDQKTCPKCGYVLSELDSECRRCAQAQADAARGPRVFGTVMGAWKGEGCEIAVGSEGVWIYPVAVATGEGVVALGCLGGFLGAAVGCGLAGLVIAPLLAGGALGEALAAGAALPAYGVGIIGGASAGVALASRIAARTRVANRQVPSLEALRGMAMRRDAAFYRLDELDRAMQLVGNVLKVHVNRDSRELVLGAKDRERLVRLLRQAKNDARYLLPGA